MDPKINKVKDTRTDIEKKLDELMDLFDGEDPEDLTEVENRVFGALADVGLLDRVEISLIFKVPQ